MTQLLSKVPVNSSLMSSMLAGAELETPDTLPQSQQLQNIGAVKSEDAREARLDGHNAITKQSVLFFNTIDRHRITQVPSETPVISPLDILATVAVAELETLNRPQQSQQPQIIRTTNSEDVCKAKINGRHAIPQSRSFRQRNRRRYHPYAREREYQLASRLAFIQNEDESSSDQGKTEDEDQKSSVEEMQVKSPPWLSWTQENALESPGRVSTASCGDPFSSPDRISPSTGKPLKTFLCEVCGNRYLQKNRVRHYGSHLLPQFHCELCHRTFIHEGHLKLHTRLEHGFNLGTYETADALDSFNCRTCGGGYGQIGNVRRHAIRMNGSAEAAYPPY